MEQLKLTEKQLQRIGFTKKVYPVDDYNSERTTYEIKTINGCFYYNVNNEKYRWYHKTTIGNGSNHIHLNIKTLPELFVILACFRVKYNLHRGDPCEYCNILHDEVEIGLCHG